MTGAEPDISALVDALANTPSPVSLLRHYRDIGLPHYWYQAVSRNNHIIITRSEEIRA